eukprot:9176188-Heterocapsa_arctica.AAC.1
MDAEEEKVARAHGFYAQREEKQEEAQVPRGGAEETPGESSSYMRPERESSTDPQSPTESPPRGMETEENPEGQAEAGVGGESSLDRKRHLPQGTEEDTGPAPKRSAHGEDGMNFQILVTLSSGRTMTMTVRGADLVGELRAKVLTRLRIPRGH